MWAEVTTLPDSTQKLLEDAKVKGQQRLAEGVYYLAVHAPKIAAAARPGQFVDIRILTGAFILRRPVGVVAADRENGIVAFIYRVIGRGTRAMAKLKAGDTVNLLGPLGNGFSMEHKHPLIVGGGMGLSPLFFYAAGMKGKADVLMGGRSEEEVFWRSLFAGIAKNIHITTDDGSVGTKGFVTELLPKLLSEGSYDAVVVCGPDPMMKAVAAIAKEKGTPCQVSLERRMGCGLGACLSCSIDTAHGRRKVCKDGPVFPAEEVFF